MKLLTVPTALLLSLSACGASNFAAPEYDNTDISAVFGPATGYRNLDGGRVVSRNYQGDGPVWGGNAKHWTSPDGCTYSRTQAPGREPVWYLVLNPHHAGKPNAHGGCPIRVMENS
ncbi:hypothetical protein ACFMBG_18830 [Leisingera sp. D0M16]|uniref:hypothetical protein n=1 Tax=Leisingera coralii TaxID=3351347 RepID=UPI003B7DAADC